VCRWPRSSRHKSPELSGSVHDGHELYDQLVLWLDRNRNGRTDRDELTPARELFTAIGMGFVKVRWADSHGNVIRFSGWMQARTAGYSGGCLATPGSSEPIHSY